MYRVTSQEQLSDYIAQHGDLMLARIEGLTLSAPLPASLAQATFARCQFVPGLALPEDLSDAFFIECRMTGLDFNGTNLFGTRFVRCDLSESRFVDCNMAALELTDCTIHAISLRRCDLDGSTLVDLFPHALVDCEVAA